MKKSDFIFSIAAIMMSVFCLTSCKEGGVVEPVPEPEPEPEVITFEVTPSVESLVFEAARPEVYEFAVETNDSTWEVTSDAEWCVIAQSETGFTVTAEPSVSLEPMTPGTVTIKSADTTYATFAVEQNGLQMWFGGNENGLAVYFHDGEKFTITEETKDISDMAVMKDGSIHVVGMLDKVGYYQGGYYWSEESGVFPLQESTQAGSASSIAIDENTDDVYFTSYSGGAGSYIAKYWKNLVSNDLTDGTRVATAPDIAIYNGDAYTVVQDGETMSYFRNGEQFVLDNGGYTVSPSCIYIYDGSVYVGGQYVNGDIYSPCYWVDGKLNTIPTSVNSQIYSIAVSPNGDIYLGGSEGPGIDRCAAYYKNGEIVRLTDFNNSVLSRIELIGDHVLAMGTSSSENYNTFIQVWIDGEPTDITDPNTSSVWGNAFFVR
ncbi:MAG TPA: hypothetical protein IAC34_01195 [Candidatus Coprenecus stercoripullorum]|nr:hypothetical protein [Candidatus Coprenecus stercoripullorum]